MTAGNLNGKDISADSPEIVRLVQLRELEECRTGLLGLINTHFAKHRDEKNLSPAEQRHKAQQDAINKALTSKEGIQVDGYKMWYGPKGNMEPVFNIEHGTDVVSYRWLGVGRIGPQITVHTPGKTSVTFNLLAESRMTEREQAALPIALDGLKKMMAIMEHAFSATEVRDITETTRAGVEELIAE